jgi:hypothetical protein
MTQAFLTCAHCGDRIGTYEPLSWERPDGTEIVTGLLAIKEQLEETGVGSRLLHLGCATPSRG